MKICPQCHKTYENDDLNFCLDDGTALALADQGAPTMVMPPPRQTSNPPAGTQTQWQQPMQAGPPQRKSSKTWLWVLLVVVLLVLLCGGGIGGLLFFGISKADLNFNADPTTPRTPASHSPKPAETSKSTKSDQPDESDNSDKPDSRLTMENYRRIKMGMTRAQVEEILGGKGKQISSSSGGGLTFTVDQWEGKDYDTIIVTFQNDKVQYMTQSGLE
jgi:hypothetical protein